MNRIAYSALSIALLSCLMRSAYAKDGSPKSDSAPTVSALKMFELNSPLTSFSASERDLGLVAKTSEVLYRFQIKNNTKDVVEFGDKVRGTRPGIGHLTKHKLKPGESTELDVELDTLHFSNMKKFDVIVDIVKPQRAEVRLPMKVYVRSDFVFTPGRVEFGTVDEGEYAEKKIQIDFRGNPKESWEILNAEPRNPAIQHRIVERARSNGFVTYDLFFRLTGEAPPGKFDEMIPLETTGPREHFVPLLITGEVKARPKAE